MIYSLMHGWDGELMDREDDEMVRWSKERDRVIDGMVN
jgi:hypothetical protein